MIYRISNLQVTVVPCPDQAFSSHLHCQHYSMRTCSSISIYRHLSTIRRRPVPCSLIHSSSTIAPTGSPSPIHFDLHATAAPSHNSKTSSSTLPTSTSPFASLAAQHPNRLQHARTLTVLHTARELITRILPPQSPESFFWNKVLCEASDEISRSNLTSKGDRITIVGAFQEKMSGQHSRIIRSLCRG